MIKIIYEHRNIKSEYQQKIVEMKDLNQQLEQSGKSGEYLNA